MRKFTKLILTFALLVCGVEGVTAQSKYLKLGNVLSLSEAITASSSTGFAIVYDDSKLLTNATTSGNPYMSLADIDNAVRGYLFKLTARALVGDVQYYRIECFNPNSTLVAAGTDAGGYGDNILSPVSWGDIWSSPVVSKTAEESGDGNAYTSDEWDGRDYKFGAQWCFESDGNGGYYIKTRADGSTNPYISGSGKMTNDGNKASFKFYSLVAKTYSSLNFNSSGIATIELSNYEVTSGLTYNPVTGVLTSSTNNEDLYFLFDNEDFSSVTNIAVTTTTSGEENEVTYSDIINDLNIYDATSGNTLHTWYSSKYGVNDFQSYSPGHVNKIRWHINKTGTMKFSGVTVTGRVVNGAAPGWDDVSTAMYNTGAVLHLNQKTACVYGKQDGFTADDYADISAYKKLKLTGVAGTTVRIYINSTTAQSYTLDGDGNLIIDFETDNNYKDAEYLHLVNIRASAYNTTANISSVQLYHDDYVLNGSGRILASAQTVLDNEEITSINATGITAATELTTANPNCLIVANAGKVTNTSNVIVNGTCANLELTDGKPFKAPVAFTAKNAKFTKPVSDAGYATMVIPFAAALPTGVKAYNLTGVAGESITYSSAGTIAANSPVMIEANKNVSGYEFTASNVEIAATEEGVVTNDLLNGGYATMTAAAGANNYVLQNNANGVNFYLVTGTAATVKPFRAYLTAPATARELTLNFGETTGISASLMNSDERIVKSEVYNLNGQRVAAPQKGLYIVNGKKVIVK